MASLADILGGSFEQLGMPRGMSNDENLRWLQSYGQPVQVPSMPARSTVPQTAMAYSGGQPQSAAATAASSMAAPSSTTPLPGMVPGAIPTPRAQAPQYQQGDGLVSLLTGGKQKGMGGLLELLGGMGGQGGLMGLLQGMGGEGGMPSSARQSPSQAYSDRNAFAGLRAIENSSLSQESKDRASRSRSGGDAHGLTSNGNPGWWGS